MDAFCEDGIEPCYYCGVPATGKDHVIPRNLSERMVFTEIRTVPACQECNSAIGGRYFPTLAQRRTAAKDHIARKYRRVLEMPYWTEEECNQLGRTLRSKVLTSLKLKQLTMQRLAWPSAYVADGNLHGNDTGKSTAAMPADSEPTSTVALPQPLPQPQSK